MKKLLFIISGLLFAFILKAQQLPLSENYFVDRYSLSSAYAGNSDNKSLFASYRRDWSGVVEGPQTIRLSYHDGFKAKAGLGGKLIMDKFGIFQSFYGLATYSYRLQAATNQFIYFGLSAGLHQNTINFSEYYNDPNFTADPTMINKDVTSGVGLVSDFSMVYSSKGFQSGFLFSNISYSEYTYKSVKTIYNPFLQYQLHATYTIPLEVNWKIIPLVIFRGGKDTKSQLEMASQINYRDRLWADIGHRGKTVFRAGFGMNLAKGILFNYNFNFLSKASLNTFQNHELTLGLKLSTLLSPDKSLTMN